MSTGSSRSSSTSTSRSNSPYSDASSSKSKPEHGEDEASLTSAVKKKAPNDAEVSSPTELDATTPANSVGTPWDNQSIDAHLPLPEGQPLGNLVPSLEESRVKAEASKQRKRRSPRAAKKQASSSPYLEPLQLTPASARSRPQTKSSPRAPSLPQPSSARLATRHFGYYQLELRRKAGGMSAIKKTPRSAPNQATTGLLEKSNTSEGQEAELELPPAITQMNEGRGVVPNLHMHGNNAMGADSLLDVVDTTYVGVHDNEHELRKLRRMLKELVARLDVQAGEIVRLRNVVTTKEAVVKKMKSEIMQLETTIKEKDYALVKALQDKGRIKQKNRELSREYSQMRTDKEREIEMISNLKEIAELSLKREADLFEQRRLSLEERLLNTLKELDAEREEKRRAEASRLTSQQSVRGLERENGKLTKEIETLRKTERDAIQALEELRKTRTRQIAEARAEVSVDYMLELFLPSFLFSSFLFPSPLAS
mmetsp:Transcript_35484/g.92446  ORF Transcript_35484/g.92446 Transcript_35484/m.92446 type:complete len:482 (-) Transcript_35484:828-2273(-)